MRIGVPTEIKSNEFRVGLVPGSVRELTARGHEVIVQSGAGAGIFADDADYEKAGARIVPTAEAVFEEAEMIVKVKEPQAVEYRRLKPHQILFTYLHLAPDPEQARGLMDSGATAIAYETVTDASGGLPLLAPMSEVAGRLAIEAAAIALRRPTGGRGVLMGGVPGVRPAKVVVLGGGVVGTHAARMAVGLGADVSIIDRPIAAAAPSARRDVPRPRAHACLDHGLDRDRSSRRGRRDRRGAGRRRQRAEARDPRHASAHEARRRARRRVDR
jgi:alanine dehydrogenase